MRFSLTKFGWWHAVAAVVIVAALIRFYQIGQVPHGMTWDEAAIGYNGHAVITTRRDEWLQFLPVSFRSFGDYKAPLAIYINGLFTTLFGMKLWVVRVPFVLSGVIGVAGMYWLAWELLSTMSIRDRDRRYLSLVAAGIVTFSPWHIHFTRTGFEAGMSLTALIIGVAASLSFLRWRVSDAAQAWTRQWWLQLGLLVIATGSLAAGFYVYHSYKLVVPLLVIWLLVWKRQELLAVWKWLLGAAVFGGTLVAPFIYDSIAGPGATRFEQSSVFGLELTPVEQLRQIIEQWLVHWTPGFLVAGNTPTLRHGDGMWGVFLPTFFLLFVLSLAWGAWSLVSTRHAARMPKGWKAVWVLGVWWWCVGLLPAAIGREVPHANRALLAFPGAVLMVIAVLPGMLESLRQSKPNQQWLGSHGETDLVLKSLIGMMVLLHGLFFASYTHDYYTRFAAASTDAFADGYLEAFAYAIPFEKGTEGKPRADQIVFTTEYGQAYIYALFARKTNPIWYQGGDLNRYVFRPVEAGDVLRNNVLIVASPASGLLPRDAQHIIYGADGEPRFLIFERFNNE